MDEIADQEKEAELVEGISNGNGEAVDHGDDKADMDTDRLLASGSTDHRLPGTAQTLFGKSNTGGPRWCQKCEGWKPDRCHHCKWCDTCVLKSQWSSSLLSPQIMTLC